ncbi:winged helix-turn-helix domain-containing protein [Embleya scabrispora]|uniref:GntR family transcriptional regulator n=1 Tax=Embleya scabrispora TaxID=159449 RepID=UPI00035FEFC4|nr:winged helix-turn-helix domain-containing protein [Embleya scabrispora]MYS83598.1 GntR family transcriptional regulator [Streptomyces sp. SID5474]
MTAPDAYYEAPDPPYRQIAADLVRDIESGALPVGKRVPSESTLIETYGVARETARRAVRYLREQGYVRTVPQRGTYVVSRDQGAEVDTSE